MSFKSTIFAAAAFLATANAHIIMQSPVPFSADKIDNAPITQANWPCKKTLDFTVSTMNKMAVGSKQTISFKGSAVHNGGLCQLSVTTDPKPSADSVFKVIKTIEGGCPGLDSSTKTFDFELPDSIPNGQGTFAWTWMPVSSGGPEYYMNCAPIEVSGGASDDSKFKELPDMLVANLPGVSTCTQVANTILKAPNPGSVVETGDTSKPLQAPTGECGATGSGGSSGGSSSAASGQPASSAAGGSPSSVPSSAASQPSAVPSSVAEEPSAAPSSAAATNPGGVFAPSASGGAAQSTMTTLVTVTAAPSVSAPVASTPVGTGSTSQPTSGTGGSGGSTCTTNGAIVCNGTTQFGICNNGNVVWQNVASGTTCSNGTIQKRGYNGRIARPRAIAAI